MDIKTQSSDVSTIGRLSGQPSETVFITVETTIPAVTKGDSNFGDYGKVVLIRGSETQTTFNVSLAPQKEERRYKNLVENRGPIEFDSTGSEL